MNYDMLIEHLKDTYLHKCLGLRYGINRDRDKSIISEDFEGSHIEITPMEKIAGYKVEHGAWLFSVTGRCGSVRFISSTATILFGQTNAQKKLREWLLANESIRGIIVLDKHFFAESALNSAIIMLGAEHEEVWLTSVSNNEELLRLFNDPKSIGNKKEIVFVKKLNAESFDPRRYYPHVQDEIEEIINKDDSQALGDVAEVIAGKNAKQNELADEGIPYIRGRDLKEGVLAKPSVFVLPGFAKQFAKQLLQEGDILLTKNFGQHKIARVRADDLPAIASNGLFIIRQFDLPDGYLYQYLSSKTGKKVLDRQLGRIETGAAIPNIRLSDLKTIRVPVFDQETMDNIAQAEPVTKKQAISMTRQLQNHANTVAEKNLEMDVIAAFHSAGWSSDDVRAGNIWLTMNDGRRWITDIALLNEKKMLAAVEVKRDFSRIHTPWYEKVYSIIHEGIVPFLILTTGDYYEIHSAKSNQVTKLTSPPTKELLLSLLGRKEAL